MRTLTAYPTICQFLQEVPSVEDTDNDIPEEAPAESIVDVRRITRCAKKTKKKDRPTNINVDFKVNSLPMPPACPTADQFLQEMPSLEDIDDGTPPESDVDTSVDVKGISKCPEETHTVTRSTYILVSEVNAVKISPDCQKVAQFIIEN